MLTVLTTMQGSCMVVAPDIQSSESMPSIVPSTPVLPTMTTLDTVHIRPGARFMWLRNIDVVRGLVNGSCIGYGEGYTL